MEEQEIIESYKRYQILEFVKFIKDVGVGNVNPEIIKILKDFSQDSLTLDELYDRLVSMDAFVLSPAEGVTSVKIFLEKVGNTGEGSYNISPDEIKNIIIQLLSDS